MFYKKVLLTLSSAGIMTACVNEHNAKPLSQVKAVVVQHACTGDRGGFHGVYCDTDGDGQLDKYVRITRHNFDAHYRLLQKTLQVGDTIKFYTATPNKLRVNMRHLKNYPDSINNRSVEDIVDSLKYQHELAKLRQEAKVH